MGIRDILKDRERGLTVPVPGPLRPKDPNPAPRIYEATKRELHQKILREIDVRRFDPARQPDAFREAVREIVAGALEAGPLPLTKEEKETLTQDMVEESMGMGPLTPYLN